MEDFVNGCQTRRERRFKYKMARDNGCSRPRAQAVRDFHWYTLDRLFGIDAREAYREYERNL